MKVAANRLKLRRVGRRLERRVDFASSWSEVGAVISSISSIKPCKNTVLSNIRVVYDRLIRWIYTHQAHDIMVQLLRSK
jgi:predicted RNA-binding protein associated with RNAse of E/G family